MKAFATEDIRNLAVIGHGDAGKTQLVSSLLHVAGTGGRWGKVDEGTTVTDYEEDSIERKISLNNNFAHLEYKDTKINLIDTPGYAAFVSHARPALRVADCALVVVDAVQFADEADRLRERLNVQLATLRLAKAVGAFDP